MIKNTLLTLVLATTTLQAEHPKNNHVIVQSPEVRQPVAVRYAFSSQASGSLMNKNGLPASPFRTDNLK